MLIGRVGQDPKTEQTKSGVNKTALSLATNSKVKGANGEYEEATEWHNVVFWGKASDTVSKWVKKGSEIYVEGPIKTNKWEDKDGNKKNRTEMTAFSFQFIGKNEGAKIEPSPKYKENNPVKAIDDDFIEDDVPF